MYTHDHVPDTPVKPGPCPSPLPRELPPPSGCPRIAWKQGPTGGLYTWFFCSPTLRATHPGVVWLVHTASLLSRGRWDPATPVHCWVPGLLSLGAVQNKAAENTPTRVLLPATWTRGLCWT